MTQSAISHQSASDGDPSGTNSWDPHLALRAEVPKHGAGGTPVAPPTPVQY